MRFLTPLNLRISLRLLWGGFFILGCLQSYWGHQLAIAILLVGGSYQALRGCLYLIGALIFERSQKSVSFFESEPLPKVTVLVPAYNEEDVIEQTLQSLALLQYPQLEILVIDDGSRDQTFERASSFVSAVHPVRILRQANAGKAVALNHGLKEASGELVLCVDADSRIESDVLISVVRRLVQNPSIAAVAGVVDVDDESSFYSRFLYKQQKLEYFVGHLQKSALALFGKTNVVPGPAGLFRKDVVLSVGGYRPAEVSYAEDMDLTLRLIAAGFEVSFDPRMVTRTQVPKDWDELMKQRYRWVRGTYQAVIKSLPNLLSSRETGNRLFGVYLFFEQFFSLALEVGILFYFLPRLVFYGDIQLFSNYFIFLLALDVVLAATSFRLKKQPVLPVFAHVIGQRFYYSIVLLTWKVFALREEWEAISMTWDKVCRYKYAPRVAKGKIHV